MTPQFPTAPAPETHPGSDLPASPGSANPSTASRESSPPGTPNSSPPDAAAAAAFARHKTRPRPSSPPLSDETCKKKEEMPDRPQPDPPAVPSPPETAAPAGPAIAPARSRRPPPC